jgi:hypothetical protein
MGCGGWGRVMGAAGAASHGGVPDIMIWKVASWYIPLFDGIYHEAIGIYHMVYTMIYTMVYIIQR